MFNILNKIIQGVDYVEKAIEVSNLRKAYKKRKTGEVITAVNDVSFQVRKGEIIGLLGPNGAGKTSTIKLICGLLFPDEGEVNVFGRNIQQHRSKTVGHISAVLEGNRNLYWRLTVQENMEYFAGNRGIPRKAISSKIDELLDRFELTDKRNELVYSLSRGMQQKLAIAVALLADTDIILLDEPTLGLDVEISYEVRKLLKEIAEDENRTIIISSHDMPVIEELCERVIIINNGQVVADEKIENLIKLFETRAYNVQLGEPLTKQQENQLNNTFPLCQYEVTPNDVTIQINLEKSTQIYLLFEILQAKQTPIENITHEVIPFEQVFLNIVKGEKMYVASS